MKRLLGGKVKNRDVAVGILEYVSFCGEADEAERNYLF